MFVADGNALSTVAVAFAVAVLAALSVAVALNARGPLGRVPAVSRALRRL